MSKKYLAFALTSFISLFALQSVRSQSIIVTPVNSNEGSVLANAIVGEGIVVSNLLYTGLNGQAGTFTGGTSAGLGFNSGIILTTGLASSASSGVTTNASQAWAAAGSAALTTLLGDTTFDANILKFDFTVGDGSAGQSVFFNFIFASEEYPEYVNQYNDAFAIFFNGNNVANNVARLPGTSIPVTINNVNSGMNPGFYVSNENNNIGVVYDGLTTNIQVSLFNLAAGPQTIEFAIADGVDDGFDSAVLIQAGSLSGVPEPSALSLLAVGLGVVLRRRRRTV